MAETIIMPESKLIGQSLVQAGLRNLKGVSLVEIIRRGRIISPVGPEEILEKGDTLFLPEIPGILSI
jgi:K+/H+ antiporter YhaU regulatory subunit KhtT